MNDTARALNAAWKLLRFEKAAIDDFDDTIVGFWRSFRAMFLVLPLFMVFLSMRTTADMDLSVWIGELLIYAISWFAFPVVMVFVADRMGAFENYKRFIIAYNWSSVWQNVIYLPIIMFVKLGVLPPELPIFALLFVLVYSWFVARTALDISTGTAIGVVMLDFFLGIFIQFAPDKFL